MAEKKFVWLPRDSTWRGTVRLEQGKEYLFSDFPENVLIEWQKNGAIREVMKKKKTIEEE